LLPGKIPWKQTDDAQDRVQGWPYRHRQHAALAACVTVLNASRVKSMRPLKFLPINGKRSLQVHIKGQALTTVTLTPRSGDHGRDVIAIKKALGFVRIIDQVKAYKPLTW
jgi:hypothetical protein